MMRFILITLTLFASPAILRAQEENLDYNTQIQQLEKSIQALTKWQEQYRKKEKGLKNYGHRSLFRDRSIKDAQRSEREAQDAYENILELQAQIDKLNLRKQQLIDAQP